VTPFSFEVGKASAGIQSRRCTVESAVIKLPIVLLQLDEAVIHAVRIVVGVPLRLHCNLVSTLLEDLEEILYSRDDFP
jgi:hypothetical protein